MKILGFIILVISGFLGGYVFYEQYTTKINFLTQYIELITLIKNSILYSNAPLKKIISNTHFKSPLNHNIKTCISYFKTNSFPEAWKHGFSKNPNLKFSSELQNLIINFGRQLGTSDSISQAQICEQHIEMIKPYLQQAINNKNQKGKLPLILGTSLGITVALLIV